MDDYIKHRFKYKISIFVLPLLIWFPVFQSDPILEVRNNGIIIGYVEDKDDIYNICDEIKKDINKEYENVKMTGINISFKSINKENINVSSTSELRDNIKNSSEIQIEGYKFIIKDNMFGIIKSKIDGENILKGVGQKYIDNLDITDKNIELVDVEADTKYIPITVPIDKIDDNNDVISRIIDQNARFPIVKVTIKSRQKDTELVDEGFVTYYDNTMYLGENKVVKGFPGKVLIDKEVTYVNGQKYESINLDKKNVVEPVDDIIYTGSKNPIKDNVKFIEMPKGFVITSGFGHRWSGFHHGIDIAAHVGDNIEAVLNGVVKETGYTFVYGNYVILSHGDGIDTLYAHCSKILCSKGQNIKKGQIIALAGSTGNSTGPHIHFELRNNNVAINPVNYIK